MPLKTAKPLVNSVATEQLSPEFPAGVVQEEIAGPATDGDVVLHVTHSSANGELRQKFRVNSAALKARSKYFNNLLDSRFTESARIEKGHAALKLLYKSFAEVPVTELPELDIADLGRISPIKSMALYSDFLSILHGRDIAAVPPIANLANLAIVADRFDALEAVAQYVQRKKIIRAIEGKMAPKAEQALSEEKVRQRLLVAILLEHPPWLEKYSARLIIKGWHVREVDEAAAMWWSLPHGVEEELLVRREYILDTIQSLLAYQLGLYTSRDRQCRLGYDSSAACDSFQLGEAIRFFTRANVLQIKGAVFDIADPPEPFAGDVFALVESLRQVPEYQVDRNHTHCGMRSKLIPILDIIFHALHHTGICSACWSQNRHDHSWNGKRPLLWKRPSYRTRSMAHQDLHTQVQALFCSTERDWDP